MNRIIRYFPNTDLRNAHDGLRLIASKEKIDVDGLKVGEFVIFVNSKQTVLKMYTLGGIIAHLKMPQGHRINPKTIAEIPRFFSGSRINYDAALREVMHREFK